MSKYWEEEEARCGAERLSGPAHVYIAVPSVEAHGI
jgi:hypothetical protein